MQARYRAPPFLCLCLWLAGCTASRPAEEPHPLPVPVFEAASAPEKPVLPPDYPFTGCAYSQIDPRAQEAVDLSAHAEAVRNWFTRMAKLDPCDEAGIGELTEPVLRTQMVGHVYALFRQADSRCRAVFRELVVQIRDWEDTFLNHKHCTP